MLKPHPGGTDERVMLSLRIAVLSTVLVVAVPISVAASSDLSDAIDAPAGSAQGGIGVGLLAVAAASLLLLGAAALSDALRRRDADEELAALAWTDGLTGLANRRRLDHDIAAYDRSDQTVSTIMIDVDHFKLINDSFGHQEGDEALRRLADALNTAVRDDDVVYRYGGEEFCVLLPDATHHDACTIAQRIVDTTHRVTLPDGSKLTVSVGVAHGAGFDASTSCRSADQALLVAKQRGRDRVVDAATLELQTN